MRTLRITLAFANIGARPANFSIFLLYIGYGVDRSLIVFSFSLNFRFFNCALVAGRTQHRIPQRRQYPTLAVIETPQNFENVNDNCK